jgi:hypothetical protein
MNSIFKLFFVFTLVFLGNKDTYAQNLNTKNLSHEKIEFKIDSLQNENEKEKALVLT